MEQFISIIAALFLGYWQGRRSKHRKLNKIITNLESQIQPRSDTSKEIIPINEPISTKDIEKSQ